MKSIAWLYGIFFLILFSAATDAFAQSKEKKKHKKSEGYMRAQKAVKLENPDYSKLQKNQVEKDKHEKLSCPDKTKRKKDKPDSPDFEANAKANLLISSSSVHFDVVELEDVHLDIPAFKLFKNNMTDFTADGEQQFKEIVAKIDHFLGKNHEGKGVTLKIQGSASQIPTSFNPSLPNNNINEDGSSIAGKTTIENNRMLAKARADELAKKIKAVFPSIQIIAPDVSEIEIGKTPWTKEVQKALNQAAMRGDKEAVHEIYEPFQKDQWVKVESKDRTTRKIQPESIKMYMLSTSPYMKTMVDGVPTEIKSVYIISYKTFKTIGKHHSFKSVAERDHYFKKLGLNIHVEEKNGKKRYYMLNGNEEIKAFTEPDINHKIYTLYKLGIVDNMDEEVLEDIIIADIKKTAFLQKD